MGNRLLLTALTFPYFTDCLILWVPDIETILEREESKHFLLRVSRILSGLVLVFSDGRPII